MNLRKFIAEILSEASINKKYNWFAYHVNHKKIVDGWDYPKDYDRKDVLDYFWDDVSDWVGEDGKKSVKLMNAKQLKGVGIDNPYDSNNWYKI